MHPKNLGRRRFYGRTTFKQSRTIARVILVPSVITLLVTLLRVMGELGHGSPTLFNSSPGGGGALIGITWLVPVFGIYFAMKLSAAGKEPLGAGRAIGLAVSGSPCWQAVPF